MKGLSTNDFTQQSYVRGIRVINIALFVHREEKVDKEQAAVEIKAGDGRAYLGKSMMDGNKTSFKTFKEDQALQMFTTHYHHA